jgi:hypothetical protein
LRAALLPPISIAISLTSEQVTKDAVISHLKAFAETFQEKWIRQSANQLSTSSGDFIDHVRPFGPGQKATLRPRRDQGLYNRNADIWLRRTHGPANRIPGSSQLKRRIRQQ